MASAAAPVVRRPAALPAVPPGGSAPISPPPLDPPDGAEAWLTLRVSAAGVDVCAPQVPLQPESRPLASRVTGPVGGLDVDGDGLLRHPLLASPPMLSLWRAPTDNDRAGGVAARWEELRELDRKLIAVVREGAGVVVRAEYGGVCHEQAFRPVPGGLLVEETAVIPPDLTDLPRVGTVFETVAGFDAFEWFGHGPWETYPDRCTAPVGRWSAGVDELFTPYIRPQESGGRAGTRWFTLTGPAGVLTIHLDQPRQVSATRHRATDLASARHHDELIPRPGCVVHLDAAHRGLGTAACGPDTLPPYLVGPGTHRWTWLLTSS